ncbi:MAG TPA: hypothetical protein VJM11_02305 [Nevskiaceae bacterium]|nr:hypothetical protein [Nevskiaceae bacterium]
MKVATFTLNAVPEPRPEPRSGLREWVEPAVRGFLMGGALVALLVATTLVFANP